MPHARMPCVHFFRNVSKCVTEHEFSHTYEDVMAHTHTHKWLRPMTATWGWDATGPCSQLRLSNIVWILCLSAVCPVSCASWPVLYEQVMLRPCCNTLQHTVTRGNTLQLDAARCNTVLHYKCGENIEGDARQLADDFDVPIPSLQHTATHCNTLQHTATHCNTLQNTATHCNTLQHTADVEQT